MASVYTCVCVFVGVYRYVMVWLYRLLHCMYNVRLFTSSNYSFDPFTSESPSQGSNLRHHLLELHVFILAIAGGCMSDTGIDIIYLVLPIWL